MISNTPPDYLLLGHICADLQPDGTTRLGGSAFFAGCAAQQLGLQVGVVTACSPDLDLSPVPTPVVVVRQDAPHSTVFENRYTPQGRIQRLHAQAPPVDLRAIPPAWHAAPIVHLGPIMQDVPPEALGQFPDALVGVTPQGWLRTVRPNKTVALEPWRVLDLPWRREHVVVLSEEDVEHDESLVHRLAQRLNIAVLTRAERGATVWHHGTPADVPAFPADAVDPTGAGDVFAAALFAALHEGQSPIDATRWACAVAAFAIERPGVTTSFHDDQIRQRLLGH
jgi:hypothetical protein